jgi:hypothetical protein
MRKRTVTKVADYDYISRSLLHYCLTANPNETWTRKLNNNTFRDNKNNKNAITKYKNGKAKAVGSSKY